MLNLADVFEALLGYRPVGIDLVITEASIDFTPMYCRIDICGYSR